MEEKYPDLNNGIIKADKPRRMLFSVEKFKKLIAGLLLTATLLGSILSFSACKDNSNTTDPVPEPPSIVTPVDPTPEVPPIIEEITAETFINDYTDEATAFAQSALGTNITKGEVFDYAFGVNDKGEITDIEQLTFLAGEDTSRTITYGKLKLSSPISPDEILDGYTTTDTSGTYYQQNFVYDAKENYIRSDFGDALFYACEVENQTNFFAERKSKYGDERVFEVLSINKETNDCVVYKITLPYSDLDSELIKSLEMFDCRIEKVSSVDFGEYQLSYNEFEDEVFPPDSVNDLAENYSAKMIEVLNTYFFAKVTKPCWGRTFDAQNLIEPEWRIITNDEGQITQIKFISRYKFSEVDENFKIGTVTLASPISPADFTAENADAIFTEASANATYACEKAIGYFKDAEKERAELLNALWQAYGFDYEMKEGEQRYIDDDGILLYGDIGEARQFNLVHIEEGKATFITLIMKYSENDQEMIELLKNPANFEVVEEYVINIDGVKVDYQELVASLAKAGESEQDF